MKKRRVLTQLCIVLAFLVTMTTSSFAAVEINFDTNGAAQKYGPGSELVLWGQVTDEGEAIKNTAVTLTVAVNGTEIHYANVTTDAKGLFHTSISVPKTGISVGDSLKMTMVGGGATATYTKKLGESETVKLIGFVDHAGSTTEADAPKLSTNVTQFELLFDTNVNYFNNREGKLDIENLGVNERNRDCFTLYKKVGNGYQEISSTVELTNSVEKGDVAYDKSRIQLMPGEEITTVAGKAMRKNTAIIKPDQGLEANTTYKVVVDGRLTANSSASLGDNQTVYFATGSNSGGSTGGSGGGTALPEKPKDNNTTIEAKPVISGDKATVTLSDSDLDNAIKNSKTGQENSITVQVTQDQLEKATKVGTLDLSLTSAQVKKLDGKMDKVVYDTPFGIVQLPLTVLSQGTGDMKLSITKVDQEKDTFIVTLSDSKGMITELKDRVKLEFPVTDATSNVLSHNGKIMKNAKVEGKNAYGITKGFSTFKAEKKTVTFGDITNHWAKSNIEFLAVRDIVNGVNKTEFGPNQSVTRSEFVKMLVNGFDELNGVTAGSAGFSDVKAGQWYTDYINWAASKKIVAGTGDGTFGTNQPISRQDMAVIMDRFAKEMDIALYAKSDKTTFADDSKIAAYAKDAVYTMQQAGIINGVGGNNFNPTGNATRAETSKMITMMIESMIQ